MVPGKLGDDDGNREAEHGNEDREDRLRRAVLGDAPDELGSDAVADREQEHQEEGRLHIGARS
jgi:hypothetical protein